MYFDQAIQGVGSDAPYPDIALSFVDGGWSNHDQCAGAELTLFDPSDQKPFARIGCARQKDVDLAVEAACRAYANPGNAWPAQKRADAIDRLAAAILQRKERFAHQIAMEIGAPIDTAREAHVMRALDYCVATRTALIEAEAAPPLSYGSGNYVIYEPAGVAALITPWNWPLNQMVNKVVAAWAAGCSVVLKPSERVPLTALTFAECVAEAGIPDGMVNILIGDGETSEALVNHPDIDVISFTGSTRVGRRVAQSAAQFLRPITLELGGKSACIVFPDASIEDAAEAAIASCFRNSGQSCNASSRLLVHRSIYPDMLKALQQGADAIELGSAHNPGSHLGPVASAADKHRIEALIAHSLQEGAKPVAGFGESKNTKSAGNFVRPTVLADVTPDMQVFRNEVFGPVMAVTPFDTEAEAIALANDSEYGLSAYIHTADPARATRLANLLDAGMVEVNGCARAGGAPFGGRKQSGIGNEGGLWGIRSFQLTKSVSSPLSEGVL